MGPGFILAMPYDLEVPLSAHLPPRYWHTHPPGRDTHTHSLPLSGCHTQRTRAERASSLVGPQCTPRGPATVQVGNCARGLRLPRDPGLRLPATGRPASPASGRRLVLAAAWHKKGRAPSLSKLPALSAGLWLLQVGPRRASAATSESGWPCEPGPAVGAPHGTWQKGARPGRPAFESLGSESESESRRAALGGRLMVPGFGRATKQPPAACQCRLRPPDPATRLGARGILAHHPSERQPEALWARLRPYGRDTQAGCTLAAAATA